MRRGLRPRRSASTTGLSTATADAQVATAAADASSAQHNEAFMEATVESAMDTA